MALTIRCATPDDMAEVVRIDDEATQLYVQAGLDFAVSTASPFTIAEQGRWRESAESERLFLAVDDTGTALGFAALGFVDRAPYLDQLSVSTTAMRRGIGRLLLRHAIDWARETGSSFLWLTTYGHLPWNRAFYEKEGFRVVPEAECGEDIKHHLEEQRRHLPDPDQRVAMRRPLARPENC